jgi:CRISPR-associated endonuclease/helicase Cas3
MRPIGSDSRLFPFSEDDSDRLGFARGQVRMAITHLGLDVPMAARTDGVGRNPFVRIAPPGYQPRATQDAVVDLPRDEGGSITILEAETGSGKTEAVLARFISLFETGLVDGLYFALPTRSAATQMYRRVHEAACRAFADSVDGGTDDGSPARAGIHR